MKIKSLCRQKIRWFCRSYVLLFVLLCGLYWPVWQVNAQVISDSLVTGGNNFLTWLFGLLISVLGSFLVTVVGLLIEIARYNDFINADAVLTGWVVLRDIANMFVVLVLLLIAFGTILRLDQYKLNSMLPKLILMAVLVNFSRVISGLIIDASQVVTLTFLSAYQEAGAGNIMSALKLTDVLTIEPGGGKVTNSIKELTGDDLVGAYFFALILMIVSLVTVAVYLVVFAVRIVVLWLLIVVSPMAYILSAVPGGQQYSSQWWGMFSKYVVVGPVLAFFLWLSLASLPNLTQDLNKAGFEQDIINNRIGSAYIVEAATPTNTLGFIISIAMLMGSLAFAQKLGGVAGKAAGTAATKLQQGGNWARKKAFAGVTYLPREWGKRAAYRTGEAVLGTYGRNFDILGSGTAALMAKQKLSDKREAGVKAVSASVASLSESDARVIRERLSRPGLLNKAARIITGGKVTHFGETEQGRAIRESIGNRTFGRDQISLPANYDGDSVAKKARLDSAGQDKQAQAAIEKRTVALYKRRQEIKNMSKEKQDQNKPELEAIEKEIVARQTDHYDAWIKDMRTAAGHTVDVEGNEMYGNAALGKIIDSFLRRNPRLIAAGTPITVTEKERARYLGVSGRAVNYGAVLEKDEATKRAKKVKQSDISSYDPPTIKSEFFQEVLNTAVKDLLEKAFKRLGEKADEGDRVKAAGSALSGIKSIITNGGSASAAMNDVMEKALNEGVLKTFDKDQKTAIRKAMSGVSGSSQSGNDGGAQAAAPAQLGIDIERYRRTQALQEKYVESDYTASEEYKTEPNAFYSPANYLDVDERMQNRVRAQESGALQHVTATDIENVNGGALRAMADYDGASAGANGDKLKPFEATLLADMEKMGLGDKAGVSLSWDEHAETLERLLPQILVTQRDVHNLDDDQLGKLEEALRNTQNISLIDRHVSAAEAMQTVSHERMESLARMSEFKPYIEAVWQALTAAEQEQMSARVRDLFGPDLDDEAVKREFFVEASANDENRFGRSTGLRFNDQQRAVWQNYGNSDLRQAVTEAATVAPSVAMVDVEQLSEILSDTITNQLGDILPLETLKDAMTELTSQLGGLDISKMDSSSLVEALRAIAQKAEGRKTLEKLTSIAYSLKEANKKLTGIKSTLSESETKEE